MNSSTQDSQAYLELSQNRKFGTSKLPWRKWLRRDRIVQNLERIQDFIIISLCMGQFGIMLIRLGVMFADVLKPQNFQAITSDILFILILVELFRLLIIYLKEQRVSVGAALEVTLVSVLREVLVQGVLEISVPQILGTCAFLTVLGGLLFLRVWMSQDDTKPEQT